MYGCLDWQLVLLVLATQYSIILWLPYFSTKNSTGSLIVPLLNVMCLFFSLALFRIFLFVFVFCQACSDTPSCDALISILVGELLAMFQKFWNIPSYCLFTYIFCPINHSLLGLNYRWVRTCLSSPYFTHDLFCIFHVFCSLGFSLDISYHLSAPQFSILLYSVCCETYPVSSQFQLL